MIKLSAVIITRNEVVHIDELIDHLEFVDEIIVVDSYSTDGTYEILKTKHAVKTYQKEFLNFANQKNHALSLASHDWILFMDADERVTEALKSEIINKINTPSQNIVAYFGLFQCYFLDKPINYSGFQTAKSYRLFRKSKCHYDPNKTVHENLVVNGEDAILKNRFVHYSYRNYEHYKQKMKQYGLLKANRLHEAGKKVTLWDVTLKPMYRFFNHYIMRLGFLDGKIGYTISKLNAYEVIERYKALKKLNSTS